MESLESFIRFLSTAIVNRAIVGRGKDVASHSTCLQKNMDNSRIRTSHKKSVITTSQNESTSPKTAKKVKRRPKEVNNVDIDYYIGAFTIFIFNLTILGSIILQVICFTSTYLLVPTILYCIAFWLLDRATPFTGGTFRGAWHRNLRIWKGFASYFNARLIRTTPKPFPQDRNYLFVGHPHGFFCTGPFINFATNATGFKDLFPGLFIRLSTLNFNFYCPFWRELNMIYGTISVDFKSCMNWLVPSRSPHLNDQKVKYAGGVQDKGRALMIIVGGAQESTLLEPHTIDLILNKRKGFVRLALESGSSLVPVITFGENDIYHQYHAGDGSMTGRMQELFRKVTGIALPFMQGRFLWILPYRVPLVSVVGEPIYIDDPIEKPSRDLINDYHAKYVSALQKLYDDHKDQFHTERSRELRIIA